MVQRSTPPQMNTRPKATGKESMEYFAISHTQDEVTRSVGMRHAIESICPGQVELQYIAQYVLCTKRIPGPAAENASSVRKRTTLSAQAQQKCIQ